MNKERKAPRISVVTACYNSTPFIDRLYQSLLAQGFRDFEWVCVDDYSTDETIEMLQSLDTPGSGGMQLYRLPFNTGGPVAVAAGVQKARGDITLIFDHDDELRPDALALMVAAWPSIADDDLLSGLMYPVEDGISGKVIGEPLPEGTPVATTWLSNRRPDISDATFVFKSAVAKQAFSVAQVEEVVLFGVVLNEITSKRPVLAQSPPIRLYHRDNPQSQTLTVRVSRKTVATYAALLNQWDRWYWFMLGRWLRHGVTLLRYSADVHGSMRYALGLVDNMLLRLLLIFLMPLAVLVRRLKARPRIVEYQFAKPEMFETLVNLRS